MSIAETDGPGAAFRHRVIVRHDQNGGAQAIVQIVHKLEDLRASVRVQIAGRFIRQENRRKNTERSGDRHALALAT